jgi:GNAT superfamily N-acetyltransferase
VREIDEAWAKLGMGVEADLVPDRMARGSRCFGAWHGHELVGYGWMSAKTEWIGEVELEIAPASGEAYIWNCVTLDPHRRKGVFRTLITSLAVQARQEGMARLWIAQLSNLAGSAIEHAGFVPVIRFDTASRFGYRWLTVAPAEGVDQRLFAAAREAMAVKPGPSLRRSKHRRH